MASFVESGMENGTGVRIGIAPHCCSNSVTSFLSKLRLVSGATFLSIVEMMVFRSFWQSHSVEK